MLALENDIESSKIEEMHTLRAYLIQSLLINWIFHPRPFLDFNEVSNLVKDLINI